MIPLPAAMTAEELLSSPVAHSRARLVRGRMFVRERANWTRGDVGSAARLSVEDALNGLNIELTDPFD